MLSCSPQGVGTEETVAAAGEVTGGRGFSQIRVSWCHRLDGRMLSTFSMTKFKGANKVLRNCKETRKTQKSAETLFKTIKQTSPPTPAAKSLHYESLERRPCHLYVYRKHQLMVKLAFQSLAPALLDKGEKCQLTAPSLPWQVAHSPEVFLLVFSICWLPCRWLVSSNRNDRLVASGHKS